MCPVLFNIYVALLMSGITVRLYVDDAIIKSHVRVRVTSPAEAVDRLQLASDSLHGWTRFNNIGSQADKSGWMLATRSYVDHAQFVTLMEGR